MIKKFSVISISLAFVLGLLLLLMQTVWKVFPESRLYGVTVDAPDPTPSLTSWFDRNFQKDFEQWFSQKIAFRAFWVRTYNQINFSIFRQISSTAMGTKVVLGKENWLYTKEYLFAHAYPTFLSKETIEQATEKLRRFQDQLERHSIAFILVISPSKATVYTEYLPRQYQKPSEEMTYNKVIPFLDAYGIHYNDSYKLFSEAKSTTPYILFPKGGVHWNNYGAFLVFREIINAVNSFMDNALPVPQYDSVKLAPPRGTDNDLARLINIWTPQATEGLCPYPNFTTEPLKLEKQPRVLIIGDSFAWHLANFFSEQQICTNAEVLYYYKRHVIYPTLRQREFHAEKMDFKNFLLEKDLIIIEINQAFLHSEIGFGFVNDALQVLQDLHVSSLQVSHE